MNAPDSFVAHFREAAPYIRQMRGTTLVAGIDGRLLEGGTLNKLAADIGLLSQLGIRLVLIHGAYHFLDRLAAAQGRTPHYCRGLRVTDETSLGQAQQFAGIVRSRFEAALCGSVSGFARAPSVPLVSGNFLTARPIGVIDGTDMEYAGVIRKTDTAALRFQLDAGNIVWMPPLGHSYGGKTFNLDMVQAAASVAVSLQAEKLVYLTLSDGISRPDGTLAETLSAQEAQSLAEHAASETRRLISSAVAALEGGVHRVQILNGAADGSLLQELFTRNGIGTSIAKEAFVSIRQAHSGDIPHIAALIRPLEEQGILLHRSREYLENHISEFSILEHDGNLYGCAALKTFAEADCGEIACLAVSPQAQDGGYGERLLAHIIDKARGIGISKLFALSTNTGEWFAERGFQTASEDELPETRRKDYRSNGRNPHILVRRLHR